jgi:hypothetical protein
LKLHVATQASGREGHPGQRVDGPHVRVLEAGDVARERARLAGGHPGADAIRQRGRVLGPDPAGQRNAAGS